MWYCITWRNICFHIDGLGKGLLDHTRRRGKQVETQQQISEHHVASFQMKLVTVPARINSYKQHRWYQFS